MPNAIVATEGNIRLRGLTRSAALRSRTEIAAAVRLMDTAAADTWAAVISEPGPTVVLESEDDARPRAYAWIARAGAVWALAEDDAYDLQPTRTADVGSILFGMVGLGPRLDYDPPDQPLIFAADDFAEWLATESARAWRIGFASADKQAESDVELRLVQHATLGWFVAVEHSPGASAPLAVLAPADGRFIWRALFATLDRVAAVTPAAEA